MSFLWLSYSRYIKESRENLEDRKKRTQVIHLTTINICKFTLRLLFFVTVALKTTTTITAQKTHKVGTFHLHTPAENATVLHQKEYAVTGDAVDGVKPFAW